jgi:anti-anti-sigma regulatory factor
LQLEGSTTDGRTIVRCRGKLVAATAEFFKAEAVRRMDCSWILAVDLAGLTDLDGSGLGRIAERSQLGRESRV